MSCCDAPHCCASHSGLLTDVVMCRYKDSLETVEKAMGADHPEVGNVHWNLAMAYLTRGDVEAQKRLLSWHQR